MVQEFIEVPGALIFSTGDFLSLHHQSIASILLLAWHLDAFTCGRFSLRRLKVSPI
jgi:hypothetical protein